jgi:hypothetical protein
LLFTEEVFKEAEHWPFLKSGQKVRIAD